jgi:hypothetical protein
MQVFERLRLLKRLGELNKLLNNELSSLAKERIKNEASAIIDLIGDGVEGGIVKIEHDYQYYLGLNKGDYIKAAKAMYDAELRGKHVSTVIGRVDFSRVGFDKVAGGFKADPILAPMIGVIHEILTSGNYNGYQELNKERKDNHLRYHFFSKVVGVSSRYMIMCVCMWVGTCVSVRDV